MADGASMDVAVHAPSGRDGPLTVSILERWGIGARLCENIGHLCAAVEEGAGAVILAEESLTPNVRKELLATLSKEPSWSDVPLVLLTGEDELSRPISDALGAVAERTNVMLLERPIRIATLITAVRSALRARERQYEIRDFLLEREGLLDSERKAREDAERANRAKSEFLAVMSHELRTPLNAIAGYTDLIEIGVHGDVTDGQREALQRIRQSERHLLSLIEGVLNYARLESGKIEYHLDHVPASELMSMAEALVAPQARARKLRLEFDTCAADLIMVADREKAHQVMLNLLSNAIKFTPAGGTIIVSCAARGNNVRLTVEDTGIGIAADKLATVFEPFVQVDTLLTRTQQGVGLGLSISRDLARGMQGDLTVASEVGKGTCFTLTLPRAA